MGLFRTGTRMYIHNVSNDQTNPDNTITATAGVIVPFHLDGAGNVPYQSLTLANEYLSFDSTYNGDKGALKLTKILPDSDFDVRITVVNTSTPVNAVLGVVLVFSDDGSGNPTSTATIRGSSQRFLQNQEGTSVLGFFGGGLVAVYPFIEAEVTRDFQLRGFYVRCLESIHPT